MATLKNLTINDTGYMQLPSGTTAQRAAGSQETIIRWTTSGYTVLQGTTPTLSNTSWTCPAGVTSIRLLMVGGGGGGGGDVGGGGGGGGLIYYGNYAVTPSTSYSLSVGAGGSGGANQPTQGSSTVFNGITAYGGAGGGFWSNGAPIGSPSTMGSGGGHTSNYSSTEHTPTTGQGHPGGKGGYNTSPGSFEYAGASGGGGAGAKGGAGIQYDSNSGDWFGHGMMGYNWPWQAGSTRFAYGGDGLAFDISGTPTFYAGGGGAASDGNSYWSVGGKGGGGRGGPQTTNDASYYGGGGGGAGSPNTGGNGYAGVIIIAYSTVAGDIRYNATTAIPELLNNAGWEGFGKAIKSSITGTSATTTNSGYTIQTFTGPGTITLNQPGTVEVLMVAGGGGGATIAGGGGGGGFVYQSRYKIPAGTYPVTVGTGGNGATDWYSENQTVGNPSTFASLEAYGGGAAVSYYSNSAPGNNSGGSFQNIRSNGGSGGGGPGGHISPTYGGIYGGPSSGRGQIHYNPGGSGFAGQGHPGGGGTHGNGGGWGNFPGPGTIYAGGGGGGAGSQGAGLRDCDDNTTGGRGMASSISGSTAHYAGGGGGSCHQPGGFQAYGRSGSAGGVGGGGAGGSSGVSGVAGTTNTGGGGGGGHHSGPNVAGSGGPGVVVIRHL